METINRRGAGHFWATVPRSRGARGRFRRGVVVCAATLACGLAGLVGAAPIRVHPENPRYFEWRGRAVALVTSGEHYGAVLNLDFDWRAYLATLQRDGLNYTRVFCGTYVEPAGAFGIQRNVLAPAAGRFLAPWARSTEPGYAGGGNKFDLDRFSAEYLARLKEFLAEANERGIVVELTLFCSTYGEQQWRVHPFHPANNIQGLAVADWRTLHTLDNGVALGYQERLVRWLVQELNGVENIVYEIQNEPWSEKHVMGEHINPYLTDKYSFPNAVEITTPESVAWQAAIVRIIREEEARLPNRHLIAQNIANFRLAIRPADLAGEVDIVNFHYAYPEAVTWNAALGKVVGYDETGFAGRQDATYRRQAWNFLLSGGGLFNHLDYSFTVGREDGTDVGNEAPGGGSPALRRQLKVLSEFLHSFDLARLAPDSAFVRGSPGVVARVLSTPGRAYAVYLEGRSPAVLTVDLPAGRWRAEWIDREQGTVLQQEDVEHAGGQRGLTSPSFQEGVALRVRRTGQ